MPPQDSSLLLGRDVYHKPRWLLSSPRQSSETVEIPVLVSYENDIHLLFTHRLEQQVLCCLKVVEVDFYYLQCHF